MSKTVREIKTTRLYLSTWDYNMARILEELSKIILKNGGIICSSYEKSENYLITNRTLDEKLRKMKREHEAAIAFGKAKPEFIEKRAEEIKELEQIPNEPILVHFRTYINFIIEDVQVYFQMSDNPFFDFYYYSNQINGNMEYNRSHSRLNPLTQKERTNIFQGMYYEVTSNEVIEQIAQKLYDFLLSKPAIPFSEKKGYMNKLIKWDI